MEIRLGLDFGIRYMQFILSRYLKGFQISETGSVTTPVLQLHCLATKRCAVDSEHSSDIGYVTVTNNNQYYSVRNNPQYFCVFFSGRTMYSKGFALAYQMLETAKINNQVITK